MQRRDCARHDSETGFLCRASATAAPAQGQFRYRLKTPYRDGPTHIVLEPLAFIARLAALLPPPQAHLTRLGVRCARGILGSRRLWLRAPAAELLQ